MTLAAPTGSTAPNVLRGILYMSVAVSLFPLLNAAVKYLTAELAIAVIIWFRYATHFIYMAASFAPRRGVRRLFTSARLGTQIVRSVLLLVATTLYVIAISHVPLTTAASISFTSPLMVVALSVPFLGERVGAHRWFAVIAGFLGAMVIIRPAGGVTHWSGFLVLGTAACYAVYQIMTRALAAHDKAETTSTYSALVGFLAMSAVMPFVWETPVGWLQWGLLLSLGLSGGFGHYLVVKAYQHGPAAVIAPFAYVQLVGATVLGYIVFGDFPDKWTWLGAAIIIGSGLYIIYREGVRGRSRTPQA